MKALGRPRDQENSGTGVRGISPTRMVIFPCTLIEYPQKY
jgi:hypothetical protein